MTVIRGLTLEERMDKLKLYEEHVDWYVGQEEVGSNGFEHIQLMFGYNNARKLSTVQIKLPDGNNVEVVKNAIAAYKYCTDEYKRNGNMVQYGEVPEFSKTKTDVNALVGRAKETGNTLEALQLIEQENITYYIAQSAKLRIYFTQLFDKPDLGLYELSSFTRPPISFDTCKVWIFVGETNLGKTQFALAHFKAPVLVRCKQDYVRYKDNVTDGLVLDDIGFRTWRPETLLHTVESETAVTFDVKYGSVRIPANMPRIICINTMEAFWPDNIFDEHRDAINRRIQILNVYNKLY